ncbi:MAG: DUF975 family protein [Clostridia bacterium]|nr:DUF975 family protein [Clostridia bacterium]
MTRAELKALAKQQIKGNIGILFVMSLIVSVITALPNILSSIPFLGFVFSIGLLFINAAFSLSLMIIYLALTAGKKPQIADIFIGFNDIWSAFKVTFLVGLFTFLWSLLFVIPGIVKACSYSQAMFILAENPGMSAREAINRSKKMMEGHKMDYFVLGLSFFGWILLAGLTFGILLIWLVPYMQATLANFYNSVKPVAVVEDAPVVDGEAVTE